jgi:hypothetical protein
MVLVLGKVTNIYINQIHNFFSLFIQLKIGLLFYMLAHTLKISGG